MFLVAKKHTSSLLPDRGVKKHTSSLLPDRGPKKHTSSLVLDRGVSRTLISKDIEDKKRRRHSLIPAFCCCRKATDKHKSDVSLERGTIGVTCTEEHTTVSTFRTQPAGPDVVLVSDHDTSISDTCDVDVHQSSEPMHSANIDKVPGRDSITQDITMPKTMENSLCDMAHHCNDTGDSNLLGITQTGEDYIAAEAVRIPRDEVPDKLIVTSNHVYMRRAESPTNHAARQQVTNPYSTIAATNDLMVAAAQHRIRTSSSGSKSSSGCEDMNSQSGDADRNSPALNSGVRQKTSDYGSQLSELSRCSLTQERPFSGVSHNHTKINNLFIPIQPISG